MQKINFIKFIFLLFGIIYTKVVVEYIILDNGMYDFQQTNLALMKTTSTLAIWMVVTLVLFEKIEAINFKKLLLLPLVFYLSMSIVYFWEGDMLSFNYPIFIFAEYGLITLFVGGALLAWSMYYLISPHSIDREKFERVLFGAPLTLGILLWIILFNIAFDTAPGIGVVHGNTLLFPFNFILPLFGEGSEGTIIILSVIFSFYLRIKYQDSKTTFEMKSSFENKSKSFYFTLTHPTNKKLIENIFEFITAFVCISSAFAISGIIINDGGPQLEQISRNIILFSFLCTLPFILFISSKAIFIPKETMNTSGNP